jgi:histidine triad (HIT) family protein
MLYAFLTIEPHTLGHTLLVPKTEIGDILDLSSETYLHLMKVAKDIVAPALKKATSAARIGFIIEGF